MKLEKYVSTPVTFKRGRQETTMCIYQYINIHNNKITIKMV